MQLAPMVRITTKLKDERKLRIAFYKNGTLTFKRILAYCTVFQKPKSNGNSGVPMLHVILYILLLKTIKNYGMVLGCALTHHNVHNKFHKNQ